MRRWAVRGLTAVGLWALILGYAALSERSVTLLELAAAVVAVLAVGWMCGDAFVVESAPKWQMYRASTAWRTFDPRFARLSQQIADASDARAASTAVHVNLDGIAERLLREKYGVDRAGDPEAARRILGDDLTSYLAEEAGRDKDVASPRVSAALDRLESL